MIHLALKKKNKLCEFLNNNTDLWKRLESFWQIWYILTLLACPYVDFRHKQPIISKCREQLTYLNDNTLENTAVLKAHYTSLYILALESHHHLSRHMHSSRRGERHYLLTVPSPASIRWPAQCRQIPGCSSSRQVCYWYEFEWNYI